MGGNLGWGSVGSSLYMFIRKSREFGVFSVGVWIQLDYSLVDSLARKKRMHFR